MQVLVSCTFVYIHHCTPNSDVDYRIFNVIILVCAYCTWGLGTPTASQHNIFDSEKRTHFSCASNGIRTFVLWILSLMLYQLSHPVTFNSFRSKYAYIFIYIYIYPTYQPPSSVLSKNGILLLPLTSTSDI